MRTIVSVFVLIVSMPLVQAQTPPVGRIEDGRRLWSGRPLPKPDGGMTRRGTRCSFCHGNSGQGGFGPDLAGQKLTFDQFKRAVREPWGVMPSFPDMTDQMLADISAHLASLPTVEKPGPWRRPVPTSPDVPSAQRLIASVGCGQCHGLELADPRREIAIVSAKLDFPFFAKVVYEHDEVYPENRMGVFSRERVPESVLREIFDFVQRSGFRVPMVAALQGPVIAGSEVTYTLDVENEAYRGSTLTAEDITVSVVVPPGMQVLRATGDGYQGVQQDAGGEASMAVWKVRGLAPQAKTTHTLVLSGTPPAPTSFRGSSVKWARPSPTRVPNAIRDDRIPETGDEITAPSNVFRLPPADPAR